MSQPDNTSPFGDSPPSFYLASQSPRRREILSQLGVPFERLSITIEETPLTAEPALDYVQRLAREKAAAGWQQLQAEGKDGVVLGADTIVISPTGAVLEKPADAAEGLAMLQQLSGCTHSVASAVSLTDGQRQHTAVSQTRVSFRALSEPECIAYWHTGEPRDKAGGYAIQGLGAVFVTAIEGSYSGVVGLPIETLLPLLEVFSVPWWQVTKKGSSAP